MRVLKLFFLLFLPAFGGLLAQDQPNAIDKYFQQYVDDERFTVVYISPKVFQLIDKLDLGDVDMEDNEAALVKDMAKDLRGLRILTTDENGLQFYKEAKAKINTREYEVLMTVRQKDGENVEFLVKEGTGGIIQELLLLAGGEDEEFTLISFVGNLDLEKIGRLAREMEKNKDKPKNQE